MKNLLTLSLCFLSLTLCAQSDYFWVGDAGNWSDLNHWATTSGGATLHTELPGEDDNVYFDANSFSLDEQTVALNVDATCHDMDWTGVTNTPLFVSEGNSNQNKLSVYGSLTFSVDMNKNLDKIDLYATDTDNTITTGEKTLGSSSSLNFETSGEWSLMDSTSLGWFRVDGSATVNTNGQPVYTSFFIEGKAAGTLNASSSIFYTDLGFEILSASFTLNAGTSTFIISQGNRLNGKNTTFNNVILKSGAEAFIQSSNSFASLTVESGANITIEAGTTQTIETLNLDGSKTEPIALTSNVPGTQATITKSSGTVNGEFLLLQDINATGGATFNALYSLDNGNNTGWNITPYNGLDYFWVGGDGAWSDLSHWATTSGGSTMHTDLPGVLDAVYFDANSGGENTEVTVTSADVTGDLTFENLSPGFMMLGNGDELGVFGSLTLSENLEIITNIVMQSAEVETVTGSTPDRVSQITFYGSGTWNMTDSLAAQSIILHKGILNTNNHSLNGINQFWIQPISASSRTDLIEFHGGSSNIYTPYFTCDEYWVLQQNITSDEVDFTGTTFYMTNSTAKTVASGGLVFNNLVLGAGRTDAFGSTNGGLQVNTLTLLPDAELIITPSEEDKITFNTLVANGTSADPIIIKSREAGEQAYFESLSGTAFTGEYLEIQDMHASGATFTANESIDQGNNTGWNISSTKQNQTITFEDIPDKTFGDPDFDLEVSASSGLDVLLTSTSSQIELDGTTVSILGTGTVTIKARQFGDDDYNAAGEVIKQFEILKASQTITFEAIADKMEDDEPFTLTATASSGLPVVFSVVNGPVTLDGSTVTIIGAGEATIRATQPGDANYEAATFKDQTFTIEGDDTEPVTGLSDSLADGIRVYPNPSSTEFVIDLSQQPVTDLWVINANGEKRQLHFTDNREINTGADFTAGLWLLEIHTGDGVYYKRLVKW